MFGSGSVSVVVPGTLHQMRVEQIVARVSGHSVSEHCSSPERHRGCGVNHRAASARVLEAAM